VTISKLRFTSSHNKQYSTQNVEIKCNNRIRYDTIQYDTVDLKYGKTKNKNLETNVSEETVRAIVREGSPVYRNK